MLKYLMISIVTLMAIGARADTKILAHDYSIRDEVVRPVTVGLSTWRTNELGMKPAITASVCCFTYDEWLRMELGTAFTFSDKLVVAPLTGLSIPMDDRLAVGAWFAPFWNLYNPETADDPWGVSIGWRF